jgi:anti-anti-sigma factor
MTVKLPTIEEQHPLKQRPVWAGNPSLAPTAQREVKVRVRLVPTGMLFDVALDMVDGAAQLTLYGDLNEVAEPVFKAHLDKIIAARPQRIVLRMENLQAMSKESARALGFACAKLALDQGMYVVGANPAVQAILQSIGVWEVLNPMETDDAAATAKAG